MKDSDYRNVCALVEAALEDGMDAAGAIAYHVRQELDGEGIGAAFDVLHLCLIDIALGRTDAPAPVRKAASVMIRSRNWSRG